MNNTNKENFKSWKENEIDDDWITQRLELCSKPAGKAGIELAHNMNQDHSKLVDWGAKFFPCIIHQRSSKWT